MESKEKSAFEQAKDQSGKRGMLGELIDFLGENKKWWLLPIIIVMLAFGLLLVLGGSAAAPFIYTLF